VDDFKVGDFVTYHGDNIVIQKLFEDGPKPISEIYTNRCLFEDMMYRPFKRNLKLATQQTNSNHG